MADYLAFPAELRDSVEPPSVAVELDHVSHLGNHGVCPPRIRIVSLAASSRTSA